MLWTEKYRPYYLSEVIGQYGFIMDAEKWVENKTMTNTLLFGIAGTGKTAAAGALANEMLGEYKQSNFVS